MIIAMYGHCDSFDVTYKRVSEGLWETKVPADLTDGKYVVDIYGIDETGYIVYWTGILYMYDSRVIKLELLCDNKIVFYDSSDYVTVFASTDKLEILFPSAEIICKGGAYYDVQWFTEY